jgi:hypothetical protein
MQRICFFTLLVSCLWGVAAAQTTVPQGEEAKLPGVVYPDAQPKDLKALDDVYAVYSEVFSDLGSTTVGVNGYSNRGKVLLINGRTRVLRPEYEDLEKCLDPDEQYKERFKEIVADYRAHWKKHGHLKPQLAVGRPYKLLSTFDAMQYVAKTLPWDKVAKEVGQPTGVNAQVFNENNGMLSVSRVFFDRHHTLALFYLVEWCGSLCGHGEWQLLAKENGNWTSIGDSCSMISKTAACSTLCC